MVGVEEATRKLMIGQQTSQGKGYLLTTLLSWLCINIDNVIQVMVLPASPSFRNGIWVSVLTFKGREYYALCETLPFTFIAR